MGMTGEDEVGRVRTTPLRLASWRISETLQPPHRGLEFHLHLAFSAPQILRLPLATHHSVSLYGFFSTSAQAAFATDVQWGRRYMIFRFSLPHPPLSYYLPTHALRQHEASIFSPPLSLRPPTTRAGGECGHRGGVVCSGLFSGQQKACNHYAFGYVPETERLVVPRSCITRVITVLGMRRLHASDTPHDPLVVLHSFTNHPSLDSTAANPRRLPPSTRARPASSFDEARDYSVRDLALSKHAPPTSCSITRSRARSHPSAPSAFILRQQGEWYQREVGIVVVTSEDE
ncbi:hypothetical protein R3P38DRAFT_3380444 [Favolaschia claudopus]|uniref:Uncharacterized protein n=1 Tax=Favolaschia claudopus TaxID=2862362 RepID=A0AAV9Z3R5_9AGAR